MDDELNLYILRGVITTHTNDYFIALNTVKVTNKYREAAHYLSHKAASKAASYLCDGGDPYVVCLSGADKDKEFMKDQLYVLSTPTHDHGRVYFAGANFDGIVYTDDLSEAAHYLSEESAHAAADMLAGFDTEFDIEPDGFWSEE